MRAKEPATEQEREMLSACELNDRARPFAAALIEREERRTGSRMAAYECVASMVGVSSAWLRRLVGRQSGFILAAHQYHNLAQAYRSQCERIEREAEHNWQRAQTLRRYADAAVEGDVGSVESTSGEAAPD